MELVKNFTQSKLVKKKNVQIYDISTDDGDLEDVFLLLTKN